jgi:hypothetical protein
MAQPTANRASPSANAVNGVGHQRHGAGGNTHDAKADQRIDGERPGFVRSERLELFGFGGSQLAVFDQLGNIQRDFQGPPPGLAALMAAPGVSLSQFQ